MDRSRLLVEALNEGVETLHRMLAEDRLGEVDLEVEASIARVLRQRLKNATLITEESGVISWGGGGPPVLVLDPIDGSTNLLRGYSLYSLSLAIASGSSWDSIESGVVVNPALDQVFEACRGSGAYLNGKSVKPSSIVGLEDAMIAIDLNFKRIVDSSTASGIIDIIGRAAHVRCIGSDALEICMVASGRLEAFVDLRGILRITDFAAAGFILEEAGGYLFDKHLDRLKPKLEPGVRSSVVACSNMGIASELSKILKRYRLS
ncbi:MAG: inositol monophosphatase [Nitrososphaerota archaeon]|nr:inositol monophosphatase [Candidatus Bathyarchaeota archaeon]MDW8062142.1 inositol monophosphatase [Nitrososphaerota archaeon]